MHDEELEEYYEEPRCPAAERPEAQAVRCEREHRQDKEYDEAYEAVCPVSLPLQRALCLDHLKAAYEARGCQYQADAGEHGGEVRERVKEFEYAVHLLFPVYYLEYVLLHKVRDYAEVYEHYGHYEEDVRYRGVLCHLIAVGVAYEDAVVLVQGRAVELYPVVAGLFHVQAVLRIRARYVASYGGIARAVEGYPVAVVGELVVGEGDLRRVGDEHPGHGRAYRGKACNGDVGGV